MKVIYLASLIAFVALSAIIVGGQREGRLRRIIEARMQANDRSAEKLSEIDVNGVKRSYILHLPPTYKKDKPLPLVIAFHGGGGNAANMIRMSGFSEKADKENFIVVYPNGSGRFDNILLTFNAVGCCAYAMKNKVDDVAFVSKLIDKLTAEYAVDKTRVYLTGFSNGALISHYLAAKLSDKIAAAAPVAGSIFASSPRPNGKVAILIIHGTADTALPYDGGMSERAIVAPNQSEPYKSVADSAKYWADNSGCKGRPVTSVKGNITTEKFTGCAKQGDVEVISIKGGLHSWPGGQKGREEADAPSTDLNATDVIWEFFEKHHK
ncbi:MAG: PHB depolymerase family esterase [Pyrinomonadaceae bacterium]